MLARILSHLRQQPVALLALFVALGGTSYAALANNSVGTKQLKKNAVTSPKVKDGSLTGSDLKKDSVTGASVLESSLGPVPAALNSSQLGGKPAAGYVSNIVTRTKVLGPLADGGVSGAATDGGTDDGTVRCHAGERAIGGGVRIDAAGSDQAIVTSRPVAPGSSTAIPADGSTTADGWRGVAADSGGTVLDNPSGVQVFAICAS